MKPTDEAILGMVSELSGRNGVNPEVASKQFSEGRIPSFEMKAAWRAADWLTRQVTSAGW
jgi:hypothetical protein